MLGSVPIVEFVDGITDDDYRVLDEAWRRVGSVTPWQQAHFTRYARAVVLAGQGTAYLSPVLRLAVLDINRLRAASDVQVGADLVTLACAARLASYGWWHEPHLRHRLLRLQFEASVDFARRLADGLPLVEDLTRRWEERAWRVHSIGDGVDAGLRRIEAPAWVARFVAWWYRRLDS